MNFFYYWIFLSNHKYLWVTAHDFDPDWKPRFHGMNVMETEDRHFANTITENFRQVASMWGITSKVVSLTTDGRPNIIAGARKVPFEHRLCTAHIVHQAVALSLNNSLFDSELSKCRSHGTLEAQSSKPSRAQSNKSYTIREGVICPTSANQME